MLHGHYYTVLPPSSCYFAWEIALATHWVASETELPVSKTGKDKSKQTYSAMYEKGEQRDMMILPSFCVRTYTIKSAKASPAASHSFLDSIWPDSLQKFMPPAKTIAQWNTNIFSVFHWSFPRSSLTGQCILILVRNNKIIVFSNKLMVLLQTKLAVVESSTTLHQR